MTIYETIKAAISVKQAAEHYGLKVSHNGMACCPFHNDRHPSLKLNEDYFFCFGCGAKGDTASQTTQESQTADASTMSGTLDEVKDFMFVVTDAQGASYAFTFDGEKPAGLDDAKIGDKVTVTYTGEISEVDPFEGEVLSVEVSK